MAEVRISAAQDVGVKAANTFRILAVGDSITEGSCASDRKKTSYPAILQEIIDKNADKNLNENVTQIEVINLGLGGRTMS